MPPLGASLEQLSPTITNLQLDTCSKDLDDSQELVNQLQIELEQQVIKKLMYIHKACW